jgi:hypothetical protein
MRNRIKTEADSGIYERPLKKYSMNRHERQKVVSIDNDK